MNERTAYINALLHQTQTEQEVEIRQLLLDIMDITEQTDLGERVCAAYNTFTGHTQVKLEDPIKPFNWSFNWGCGGYNSVIASTREEALQKAEALGANWESGGVRNLVPDADYAIRRANDKAHAGMFD